MADQRTYTGGRFALDINGENAGYLKKFSGLAMEADVITHDLGPDNIQKKHVGPVKWTPGKATIGIGMGSEIYSWIKAAFDKGYVTKSGALTAADFNYKAQSVMTFTNALITSLTVPKLDGSSKDAAYFDVEFDAEQVRWSKGGGEDIRGKVGPKQKAWLCSNFRLELGGLPCNRVASIDSFTWKCSIATDSIGTVREYTKHPAKVTVPDLKVSVSMADYDAWQKAASKWFISGECLEENEMQGRIVFLNPNMKDEIGEIELQNCGFKKFSKDDSEANSEKVARFNAEFYVEKMIFKLNYFDSAK
jgi:phage tail-like protein